MQGGLCFLIMRFSVFSFVLHRNVGFCNDYIKCTWSQSISLTGATFSSKPFIHQSWCNTIFIRFIYLHVFLSTFIYTIFFRFLSISILCNRVHNYFLIMMFFLVLSCMARLVLASYCVYIYTYRFESTHKHSMDNILVSQCPFLARYK